jgi:PTH1 family peptidyl-tRNA hydrolase
MILIIGLGNPGIKYIKTRHNIGFRVLDEFQNENNFSNFEFSKKFNSLISDGTIKNKTILLAKPQTFMNNSGKSVKDLINFYKMKISDIIVIHDDIDLVFGTIRISEKRGSAGHKGVKSIIKELGTKDFTRIRIGIRNQRPGTKKNTEKYVLEKFTEQEEQCLEKIIKESCHTLKIVIFKG